MNHDGTVDLDVTLWVIFDFIFFIDILLKFITAFQKDNEWVLDINLILLNYLKTNFVIDMISLLPCAISFE